MKGYPRGFLTVLAVTFVTLAVSGLLLLPTLLDLRFGFDVVWRLPGGQRVLVAAVHSAVALLLCGLAGAVWAVHARCGWRSRRRVASGATTAALTAGAAATSIGLFYLGDETWLASTSAAHALAGIGAVAMAAFHGFAARAVVRSEHGR